MRPCIIVSSLLLMSCTGAQTPARYEAGPPSTDGEERRSLEDQFGIRLPRTNSELQPESGGSLSVLRYGTHRRGSVQWDDNEPTVVVSNDAFSEAVTEGPLHILAGSDTYLPFVHAECSRAPHGWSKVVGRQTETGKYVVTNLTCAEKWATASSTVEVHIRPGGLHVFVGGTPVESTIPCDDKAAALCASGTAANYVAALETLKQASTSPENDAALTRLLERYNWDVLRRLLVEVKSRNPEETIIVTRALDDVPLALAQRLWDVARFQVGDGAELFPDPILIPAPKTASPDGVIF